jgi:amidase
MHCTRRDFVTRIGSAVTLGALAPASLPLASAATSSPASAHPLCFTGGRELARLIRDRKVSAREVMTAHLRQIERLNPTLNAIVAKLDDAKCLALADEADQRLARGERIGPLHGLPFAHKDTEPAVGFPFTRGSVAYKNDMPKADSVVVERLRQAGVVAIGKTNIPEFGFGSHTYNRVYGTTCNPYDTSKSAGGSSGGAGAALAAGMLPLANGSDLAGSLRNPGNFNNIVGYRPTVGLVPLAPIGMPFVGLTVKGPLARSVADAAFLLSAMAGPDGRDPGSYPSDPAVFTQPLDRSLKGVRIAWCPDLGGLPLDPRVRTVLDAQRPIFERLGCLVDDAAPDLSGAEETFLTLRAWRSFSAWGHLLATHRGDLKPEAVTEIESGAKVSGTDVSKAMVRQAQVMERMRLFQEKYAFVCCAVNQIPPFDAKLDWPKEISGTKMEHYIAWMRSAYWITVTSCPSISVPAGFTPEGLPVGIQIVGRYRADFELLQFAHGFEQATNIGKRRPAMAG